MSLEPRARATDPETSQAAAARMRGKACRSHFVAIMGALWRPMIPPEIAKLTGLDVVQIDRRRKELLDRGAIRLTGRVRDGYQEWERA
jgi:hypothetical protein